MSNESYFELIIHPATPRNLQQVTSFLEWVTSNRGYTFEPTGLGWEPEDGAVKWYDFKDDMIKLSRTINALVELRIECDEHSYLAVWWFHRGECQECEAPKPIVPPLDPSKFSARDRVAALYEGR